MRGSFHTCETSQVSYLDNVAGNMHCIISLVEPSETTKYSEIPSPVQEQHFVPVSYKILCFDIANSYLEKVVSRVYLLFKKKAQLHITKPRNYYLARRWCHVG